ncbi:hypothetical protein B1B04_16925 [Lysinibacillus sp. KCTC 33748]|uniref:DUF1648 domain-containing protein n=1 Tax=unclassified Lysinibacillus TaxID=2636778 RepID=UPI0009A697BA|nr:MULTISPECIES: DUF5808 domain-containing protein [unclassified Lysinibacillus]OXS72191.1 hypothetical protein B1B04_16925 [Lysinibacillus sp. KCTC 33748]SKB98290.1 Uncharacterized membrane protein [Lysinibacillus sp. AC-3]
MDHIFWISIILFIPIFIILIGMPYWTRRTESFGVSIPSDVYMDKKLKKMRKQYASVMTAFSIVILFIFYLIVGKHSPNDGETMGIVLSITILGFMIISFLIYLVFHKQMKQLKEKEKWNEQRQQKIVLQTNFYQQKLIYSNYWFLITFALVAVTLFITFTQYGKIPERIPTQYDLFGGVTNWTEKSYRSVLIMPITQIYMIALFMFINWMIGRSKQQLNAQNPDGSIEQNIIFRRRWSVFLIASGILLTVLFSVIQLSFIYSILTTYMTVISLMFPAIMIIGVIVLVITTGQGGSRVKNVRTADGTVINRDDDHYWKLGQFYFNRNDPSLFLEKRFGVGWTINLAKPLAWLILIGIFVIAAGLPILLSK